MKLYFLNFIKGIKNLIKWLPIIWYDRDYDYEFCERIILFKLKEMRNKLILTKYPIVNWKYHKKEAQALKLCINILERRKEGWYSDQYYSYYRNQDPKLSKIKLIDEIETRDWKIFCKLFETYFQSWWD